MKKTYHFSEQDYQQIANRIVEYVIPNLNSPHISFELEGTLENDYTWVFQFVGKLNNKEDILQVLSPMFWNLQVYDTNGEELENNCLYLKNIFGDNTPEPDDEEDYEYYEENENWY